MKSLIKILCVLTVFTTVFYMLRTYGQYIGYDTTTLVADLGGLAYLYSTVGTIFAIFAAFVIVSESQDWNTLSASARDEVRELNEMFLWSRKFSAPLAKRFSENIELYLETVIEKEWQLLESGDDSFDAELAAAGFHDLLLAAAKEDSEIAAHLFNSFSNLLNHRSVRIEYSWQPLPFILKFTVFLVAIAVMCLSLFIGVKDIWLDYLFMACIVTLVTVILIVVDDLDNPLRPGDWCLTSSAHQRLLNNIRMVQTGSCGPEFKRSSSSSN